MTLVLFMKAHIKGHVRKDGAFVKDYDTKKIAAKKPVAAKWPQWTAKKPLDLSDGEHVDAPAQPPSQAEATSYPSAVQHPRPGPDGKPFHIKVPSVPSVESTWTDPAATAVFVPDGEVPAGLNGIAFAPWADAPTSLDEWQDVDGQMIDLVEPDLLTHGKDPAAGVIIEEADGRVWLVNPSNGFGGYKTTFPKGRADDGISLQATAIKEAFEETGLQVEITGFVGDVERELTTTRYYKARRVGGTPAAMGWETQAVQLVPQAMLHATVNRDVDRLVADIAGYERPAPVD